MNPPTWEMLAVLTGAVVAAVSLGGWVLEQRARRLLEEMRREMVKEINGTYVRTIVFQNETEAIDRRLLALENPRHHRGN